MPMKRTVILVLTAAALLPSATDAQTFSGTAVAVDGDSLVIDARRIRLAGIDAPEVTQSCNREGESWQCGQVAKEQLAALVRGRRVECHGVTVDTYSRTVATCTAGYDDINRTMVEQGWAVAFRKYSDAYVGAEDQARANRLGIWGSEFVPPSDYRRSQRPPEQAGRPAAPRTSRADPAQPGRCVIKGNRNRKGQWIYHLPGMPYYDATRPEEIFCTEADAQSAGYRRAIVRP